MKIGGKWTVLYEDCDIAAVNKASGIAVSGDRWSPSKERLDKLLSQALGLPKLFVVHRIDCATSGVVVFAKNEEAHRKLSSAFEKRAVEKVYTAVVHGRPSWKEAVCELPLLADGNKKHETIVEKFRGKKSLTRFKLLHCAGNYSVLSALPQTGRQHQIRVHLAALGHAVVCDEIYGKNAPVFLSSFKRAWRGEKFEERPLLSRLGLHAESLRIPEYPLNIKAPFPKDLKALLNQIKKAEK